MPGAPDPDTLAPVPDHHARPAFTRHFDMRPTTGPRLAWKSEVGEYLTWVRSVEEPACHPMVALLAMGDALPPAATALFTATGPLRSMHWYVNMLPGQPPTHNGRGLLPPQAADTS